MATVTLNGSALGTALMTLLSSNDAIMPGAAASYELCKLIYTFHPLGQKMVEKPLELAQSQQREISIPNSPETRVKEAFENEWIALSCDRHILNVGALARTYGIGSVALMLDDLPTDQPVDFDKLAGAKISFNCYDPLNTAGSLVLNQNPTAMDFQHITDIRVGGKTFHRSRTCVLMNERPIYIEYTNSAFGFVGRSCFQRALFPLKSFIQSMIADDLVERKVAVIIAKIKSQSSVIDEAMSLITGQKRDLIKEAQNGNVLSVGDEDSIESINLQNLDGPHTLARKNILDNIASAAGMPAKLLTEETFAEGFGEGSEDAKQMARFINKVRQDLKPLYDYFDKIVMYRAWNEDFYKTIQVEFPEYKDVPYKTAFYQWRNSFVARWPNLLEEPDSEKVRVDEVKLRSVILLLQVLLPEVRRQPENRAALIEYVVNVFNDLKFLFPEPLDLNFELFAEEEPPPESSEDPNKAPAPRASLGDAEATIVSLLSTLGQGRERRNVRKN